MISEYIMNSAALGREGGLVMQGGVVAKSFKNLEAACGGRHNKVV